MKKYLSVLFFLLFVCSLIQAQDSPLKYYPKNTKAGEVLLLKTYGEYKAPISTRTYVIDVPATDYFYINVFANLKINQDIKIYVDEDPFESITGTSNGWQIIEVSSTIKLQTGKHYIMFVGTDAMVPMIEEILVTRESLEYKVPPAMRSFLDKIEAINRNNETTGDDLVSKVLPNPEGEYSHAIDTAFAYSHFSWVYLTTGYHTFTTSGSTVQRSLAVFNTTYNVSSANVNSAPFGESLVTVYVASAGYFAVTLRPTASGASGTTNIVMDGTTLVPGAVIGGKYYSMPQLRGGDMNFFTSKLSGSSDTRIFVSKFASSSIRGYNDDYNGAGAWNWGLSSRVRKTFNTVDSVQFTFVCAYSPSSTGTCDIYMGNQNSNVYGTNYSEFPLLNEYDAIRAAPSSGYYNCISWSGGITSTWVWPPSAYSTYSCTNAYGDVTCFDNFYSNNPVRYPGAYNYTRTGATFSNSVVDLWKLSTSYTHASVRKPGNNHPHGYDWESKPGGLTRTFHPRDALTNNSFGYGAVNNYYKATGTYARNSEERSFATDADAVKAGVAIFDKAVLSPRATEKLSNLLQKVMPSAQQQFNELYILWDATKEANGIYSDPSMYCKNKEFKAMESFALANHYSVMLAVFDKFIKGDHLIGDLMWTLTKEKYGKLMDEVKTERLANLYDKEGRYRIHGDHDNGVLYVEKILRSLQEEVIPVPVTENVMVSVSPNPVTDRLTVQVKMEKTARVSVVIVSTQTGMKQVVHPESILAAGTHRFETSVKDITNSGTMLAVQVTVDGVMKTVKVMVMK